MKKKLIIFIISIFTIYSLGNIEASSTKLNKNTLTLGVDNTYTLKVLNNKKKVTWSTNKKSVATINKGVVTGKKAGTAVITAKIGKKAYKCKVTVKNLVLSKKTLTLQVSDSATLKLSNNTKKITWSSSNKSIATVSNGKVTAKKAGTVTITAKVATHSYTCKVTVKTPILNKTTLSLQRDKTFTLKVSNYSKDVVYSSSNTKIVTVSKTGVLTPKGLGSAIVYAKVGDMTLKCSVTIIRPTIRINPNSSLKKNYTTNDKTKHYFLIRSYMEYLESMGGGTLILEKGTYNLSNTIYIPSYTNIKLENATINKINDTGNASFSPSSSMFQFVSKKIVDNGSKLSGYNGTHDSSIIGTGTLNMNYTDGCTIIIGHAKNIKLSGITFKNMYNKHFIELDATNNCTISNCTFQGYKAQTSGNATKEAINIDTPDSANASFNNPWSSQDKTPDTNITISQCTFKDLGCAIGTHQYSYGKRHTNIKLLNNTFSNISDISVHMLNWSNVTMTGNKFTGNHSNYPLRLDGIRNLTMKSNTFTNFSALFKKYYSVYSISGKSNIYAYLTEEQKKYISVNNTYNNTPVTFSYVNYGDSGLFTNSGTINYKNYTVISYGQIKSYFNSSITYETETDITYTYNGSWSSKTERYGDGIYDEKEYELTYKNGQWIETRTSYTDEGVVAETYNYTTKQTTKTVE